MATGYNVKESAALQALAPKGCGGHIRRPGIRRRAGPDVPSAARIVIKRQGAARRPYYEESWWMECPAKS